MINSLKLFHLARVVSWLSGALLASVSIAGERPNIVIILADDLGIGDVSTYNENSAWQTPHIDRLAAGGMSFADAHTGSALCTPTRYGILTGRYSWRSRLKRKGASGVSLPFIPSDRTTIADVFKQAGYQTGIVGKWHLGWNWALNPNVNQEDELGKFTGIDYSQPIQNGPASLGFDYTYCMAASLSSPPFVYVENNQPTSIPQTTSVNYDEKAFWRKGPIGEDFNHAGALGHFTQKSVDYIKSQAGEDTPFFLYVAFTAPHAPIIPTTEFIGKSNASAYGDFVIQVDHSVGQITSTIAADPRLKNTLVFFTSDNGQSPRADFRDEELPLAGHNGSYIYRGKKFDIYEGGHRVPFIAAWPGQIAAGSKSAETICTVDFMATAAELLGADLADDEAEDSVSFLSVLKGDRMTSPLREATVHHSSDGRFAIRKGDWKLVLWPGSGGWAYPATEEDMQGLPAFQLFNLKQDIAETTNVLSQHPQKVFELKSLLTKYIKDGRSTPGARQSNDGDGRWPELEWME